MTKPGEPTIHASAVLIGDRAVLVRGPSGSGKSRLALDLILAGRARQIPPATLVGDDRVHVQAREGRLIVRPAPALAGLIEVRGLGIRRCGFAEQAIVGLVADLDAVDAARLPEPGSLLTEISGIKIPRIPVGRGFASLPLVIAALTMAANSSSHGLSADCRKGIGNHICATIATD